MEGAIALRDGNSTLDPKEVATLHGDEKGKWVENPAWHMATINSDMTPRTLTAADCISALVAFSKKDGFAKGRIVKQLQAAGFIKRKAKS
jgi:hypothetical protein